MTNTRIPTEADLHHLVDRIRRGTILPAEVDQLDGGIRGMAARLKGVEAAVVQHSGPAQEQCCVCGSSEVTYHNYREQPFCWPCADCSCNQIPCVRNPCEHCGDRRHPHRACDPDHLRTELAGQQAVTSDYRVENEALRRKLAAFHEGEEPYLDEYTVAKPAQWIWHWNRATPAQRLEMAARIQQASATADRCLMLDHEMRLNPQEQPDA